MRKQTALYKISSVLPKDEPKELKFKTVQATDLLF